MYIENEDREDSYSLFVPIEDHDLMKSVEADENGDYIVQGVMSSADVDEEGDSITPEGMDCSYFLEKGWIKYEHGNSPQAFIGEPLEVKIGKFEHPTLHKSVNGVFVKGRLFAHRALAKEAVQAIQDLQKSNTKRTMGWSIEGNVKERDRKTGKIIKSVLRNVVLTLNPVNTTTYVELAKSFAKNHELTIDMEKSMDIATTASITPQSIEGYDPKQDEQTKWIKLFREFVKRNCIQKSLRREFTASPPVEAGLTAYNFALEQGLDDEGAMDFATYIAEKQEVLKSLFRNALHGGEKHMSKLAEMLDADLEELRKSLELEEDYEDEEEIEKSINSEDKEDSEEDKEEGSEDDGDEYDDEKEDEEEEDHEDKKVKKSFGNTDFAKSLASDSENAQAFEVSDFLVNLVDEVGYHMDGFEKSMTHVTRQQSAIAKSLLGIGDLVKSLTERVEDLQEENSDLKKSLNDLLEKPVGRRSAVSTREVETIKKSIATENKSLNRGQIGDVLMKSFEAGEIPGTAIARFEAGVSLDNLSLPKSVLEKLGL